MTQPVLSIRMVPAGVDLVLEALGAMPYGKVAGLVAEIQAQAQYQLLQQPAPEGSPNKPAADKPVKMVRAKRGGRPKGSRNKPKVEAPVAAPAEAPAEVTA